jgi:predicted ATPase/class 3 adenylate cyclase
MNSDRPTANRTYLFTDIEGSTRLWETEPLRMAEALARHDHLCRKTVDLHGGRLVKMIGDGMHAVFEDPSAAVAVVLQLQQGMAAIGGDCGIAFKMRCGLHAGASEVRDGDYFGTAVNRAARIMSAGHGGQILLSRSVVELANGRLPPETDLMHLGRVRLRDLSSPEDIWQLVHPELCRNFPALRSLDLTPNNLPQDSTSFIGRKKEIAEVRALLGTTRLLTLTGAGGCGKTRLALHVAAEILEQHADGAWLVELAALGRPELVPQAVATVLGIREVTGQTLVQTLVENLQSKHLLLILDNAEHLQPACAKLAREMSRTCPQLTIVATSRVRLGIDGESAYRVPSLTTPDPKLEATPERLLQFESARLYVDRAQQTMPRFAVTEQNAPALASVCRRLDGIPLAIELAAARMRSMSVEELDRRLDQRFRIVTGGARTAPRRQQTLRALIDWSYDLLDDSEKNLLCRVAAFSGGCTLQAAETVCAGDGIEEWEVLDLLTSLSDKSLVVAEEHDIATRYHLLETVRQYAGERLMESGTGKAVREGHRNHFLALAEEAESELMGAAQAKWLERLEVEHENLRAALEWSLAAAESAGGLRLCGALWRFWWTRGHLSEGREWCQRALGKAGGDERTAERAKVLYAAGAMAYYQGDYPSARARSEESLAIRRQLGDRRGLASSLNILGNVAVDQGDFASAQTLFEESLAIDRELGDQRGIAAMLSNLGSVAQNKGDYQAAATLYEESLAIIRELGDRGGIAIVLICLGLAACGEKDYPAARMRLEESLAIGRELGDRRNMAMSLTSLGYVADEQGDFVSACALYQEGLVIQRELGDMGGVPTSLEGLAATVAALDDALGAARIWGAAERLREEIGSPMAPNERPRYHRRVAAARAALGDDVSFDRAWQDGRALTRSRAIEIALEETVQHS